MDATLHDIGDAKLARDLRKILGSTFVMLRRRARNHLEIGDLRQARQELILNSFGEIGVRLVVTQIFKRQDGDAFLRRG